MQFRAALLCAALLCLALGPARGAAAEEPAGGQTLPEQSLLELAVLDPDGEAPLAEPPNRVEELPHIGVRPQAPYWNRLGLFAEFRGTTLRLRGTLYDAAGGASLFLRDRLALTGSYRVQGYDPYLQGSSLGSALAGPFFSLSLRY